MQNLPIRIALRYLFSRKRHNAVNIISMISVAGVAVASAAMIVVLSVFNGFADLAEKQLARIDPPLAIFPKDGKVIENADSVMKTVKQADSSAVVLPIVLEQALATTNDRQMAVHLLGVEPEFLEESNLESIVLDGFTHISEGSTEVWPAAMTSVGVALGIDARPGTKVCLFVPKRVGRISTTNATSALRSDTVVIAGVYEVEHERYDVDMLIVPIGVVRNLLDYGNEATSIVVYPKKSDNTDELKAKLREVLGENFRVADRMEQQESSFKIISVEKWITFLMLVFILIIASFNIISTMAMLIIEKEDNSDILISLGATTGMVRRVYAIQGFMISIAGGIAGIATGIAFCLIQQHFGLIRLNADNPSTLTVDFYPVVVDAGDIFITGGAILVVGFATALISSMRWK